MFAKKKTDFTPDGKNIRAFLEHGCEFEGKLTFSGEVRLNGKLKGEIVTDDFLIVGETAEIEGTVNVGVLIVGGRITGTMTARNKIEVLSTGSISGTIQTPLFSAQEGAQIDGQIRVLQSLTPEDLKRS